MFKFSKNKAGFVLVILVLSASGLSQDVDQKKKDAAKDQPGMPLEQMVKVITEQPTLVNQSFYYDDGFKAVGSYSIHDHFAKRMCMGYLVSDGQKLAYRYIRAMPGLGSSNDAFETEIKTIYLSLSRRSALGEAFGLAGAAAGAMKKRKLLLSLMISDDQGRPRRCVFFLPQAAPREFVEMIEKKSGRNAIYESEEARLATQERSEVVPAKNE